MPSIPLSFIVAFLAALLALRAARTAHSSPTGWLLPVLLGNCALQAVLVGLRWSYPLPAAVPFMATVASTLPPLAYLCFVQLAGNDTARHPARGAGHLAGPLLVVAALFFAGQLVDAVLLFIYLGYAAALLHMALRGPDVFLATPFGNAVPLRRALLVCAIALALIAGLDASIALDFAIAGGQHAASIVGLFNAIIVVTFMLALLYAAATGGAAPNLAGEANAPSPAPVDAEADRQVVAAVDELLEGEGLYKDPNLTLLRLARKAGKPARQVSAAINRVHSRNVSQHINALRIAEAQRLLEQTTEPVSSIMLEAGFQTKSNFNREFRRTTGMSPLQWRSRGG